MIVLYTLQSLLCKFYTDNYPGNEENSSSVFTIVCGIVTPITAFVVSSFSFSFSYLTILFGVLNAITLYVYYYLIIKASATGPYSVLISFSLSGAIILPTIANSLFFDERLGYIRPFIIVLIVISSRMISQKSDEQKITFGFLLCCIALGISNGIYGTLLNAQQECTSPEESSEMVALTFFGAAVISVVKLFLQNKSKALNAFKQTKKSLFFLIVCSLISSFAIHIFVYILPLVNVTLLYTFDSSGVLLLSVIASAIFFKEKLNKKNIAGCCLLCCCLIAMTLADYIEDFIVKLI